MSEIVCYKNIDGVVTPIRIAKERFFVDGLWYKVVPNEHCDYATVIGFDRETISRTLKIPEDVYGWAVKSISDSAFYHSEIESIIIPPSVTAIGDSAFADNYSLRDVSLPHTIRYIGEHAFNNCLSLEGIIIPDSVTYLDDYAFSNCISLRSIRIGQGVRSIGSGVFSYCSKLQNIIWGNYIESIGYEAFSACKELECLFLPNRLRSIGTNAFAYCAKLKVVCLPQALTECGSAPFRNCDSIKRIYCLSQIPPRIDLPTEWTSSDEVRIRGDLYVPRGSKELYAKAYIWESCSTIKELLDNDEVPRDSIEVERCLLYPRE